MMKMRI